MKMTLKKLEIENFKGIKKATINFDGRRTTISGPNGWGKTSRKDAHSWLWYGKDSDNRTDFEIHPLDKDNQIIPNLVTRVSETVLIDNDDHIFTKKLYEKRRKDKLLGYETLCWIDDVPKKVGEFEDYINDLVSGDDFKLLTDPYYFGEKLHWTDRRKTLLGIAGDIPEPEGFAELLEELNGRTVKEYKGVLIDQKGRHTKERDEIGPRIDELQRGLDDYAKEPKADLTSARDILRNEVVELDAKRTALLVSENARQKKIEKLNELKADQVAREVVLRNDTSGISHLLSEKKNISSKMADLERNVSSAKDSVDLKNSEIENKKIVLSQHQATAQRIKKEHDDASQAPMDNICRYCNQPLPADMLETIEEKHTQLLKEIEGRGKQALGNVKKTRKELESLESELDNLRKQLNDAEFSYNTAKRDGESRLNQIEIDMANKKTLPPEQDPVWQSLQRQIEGTEADIGLPVSEQLNQIEAERNVKVDKIEKLNTALKNQDQMTKAKTRIGELENREKELSQLIADIDMQLEEIGRYTMAQCELIDQAVNDKFKYIKFILFKQNLNGSIDECCDASLNGVPYSDLSTGQRIRAGIDIINILSSYYDKSVPLFIDHAESLTFPIEATSQVIELRVPETMNLKR